ncbi:hypothetical protein Tco_1228708 [Tanacetum coccineum]
MASSDPEVKTCSKTCLKNNETLKKQYDDLRTELNKSQSDLANYKRGLASVEERLIFFKKNEVVFCEKVDVLKRDVSIRDSKINEQRRSQIADNSRKGVGFISYNVVPPPHTGLFAPPTIDLSSSGLEEFQQPEFEGYGLRANKSVCENSSNETKKNSDAPLIEEWVSENEDEVESPVVVEKKTVVPTIPKVDVVRPKQQEKPVRKTVRYAEMYRSKVPRGNQRNWNNLKSQQLGSNFVMYNKAFYVCGSFNHLQINCHNHQRRDIVSRNNYNREDAKNTHPNVPRNMSPKAVLLKTGLTSLNTVRPVNTAHPKTAVHSKPRHDDKGFVDSGCSRHMTGNIAYLSDFKLFDGGYVAFGGCAYGGKIIGKGTLKTDNLDFKDIYFVNELKFNLFSVSQILVLLPKKHHYKLLYSIDQGPFELGTTRDALRTIPEEVSFLDQKGLVHMRISVTRRRNDTMQMSVPPILCFKDYPKISTRTYPNVIYKLINHNIEAKGNLGHVKMLSGWFLDSQRTIGYSVVRWFEWLRCFQVKISMCTMFAFTSGQRHEALNFNKDMITVQPHAQSSHVQSHQYPSSSTNPQSLQYPQFPETSQIDSGYTQTDEILDNLTKQMALLAQSFRATLPQTNNQLRTSSNTRNQATIQDGRVVVQNVQGRQNQNQNQRYVARGNGAAGNGGHRIELGMPMQDKMLLMQAQENGAVLDEEELLFLAGEQENTFDADVDNQPVQDLALSEDNIFQADECDAFDSDVDDEPSAQTIFMANLSSAGSANPQA